MLSPEESIDLYSVREVLECMAAEIAPVNINEDAVAHLEKNLVEQQTVIAAGDLVAYARLDSDFHGTVYKLSENSFLIDILNDIRKKMHPMVIHIQSILNDLYQDHVTILNALRNRDSYKAKEAFRKHNERMKNLIWQVIEENQPKIANL